MTSPEPAQLPPTIGRYTVVDLLGTGAFSAVYRAIDERVGGDVAIKLLADHHSLDPDIRERFIAEARLLRRISDRRVVGLYELDETDRHQPYLVLEYVDGGNLAQRRESMQAAGRTVGVEDLTRVAANVDAALSALHVQRIVHRDLSPRNLLVRGNGGGVPDGLLGEGDELVLADLGLSKDLAASSGLTAAAGTDGFAAPEQRRAGIIDERADVYAASALLAWLALGRTGPTRTADLTAAGWPEAFGRIVGSGLDPDPERRPPSIAAWRAAVDAALRPPRPAPARHRPTRRRLVVTAAVAAVAAAGTTLGALQLVGGDDPSRGGEPEPLDDDRLRVEHVVDDVTVAFEGPATLERDQRVLFRADVDGAPTWVWTADESGGAVPGAQELALTPRAGTLTLNLTAITTTGEAVVATHTFTVAEPTAASEPAADETAPPGT